MKFPAPSGHCACGKPLHYESAETQASIERLCAEQGENVVVTVGQRSWLVQRHYIALHGIKSVQLATLGFPEISAGAHGTYHERVARTMAHSYAVGTRNSYDEILAALLRRYPSEQQLCEAIAEIERRMK